MGRKDRFGFVGKTVASTFRVEEVVAEGGFGIVYRAFHVHFRAPVALKCLKIPTELTDEERIRFLEQFRSEAEIMFRLSASLPNIVRPLHVDAVHTPSGEFVPLMALEWLEGESFEKILEGRALSGKPPMSLEELVELLGPAVHALDQAHNFSALGESLAVVHRDVKPDNLFLCKVGDEQMVKVLDFGISKVRRSADEIAGHFSQTGGQASFSPAYGAPEQWVPKRYGQTGPWTDVWGLALTLVEMIKGDAVISGDHQAMMGTALDPKVRPTPRNEGVDVADEVEAVFGKALAVDPRYRYQHVRTFWSALREAMKVGRISSQSRIRLQGRAAGVDLPPMSAPTPWEAQRAPTLVEFHHQLPGLPAMLVPASHEGPLDSAALTDSSPEPFYPKSAQSGLAPVLPAPGAYTAQEIEIPRLDADMEEPLDGPSRGLNWARRSTAARDFLESPIEPAIELAPTSTFPPPVQEDPSARLARPQAAPLDVAPAEESSPLSLIPPSEQRSGRGRRR